jgi:tetratricopeptide (TPR) repeat protein
MNPRPFPMHPNRTPAMNLRIALILLPALAAQVFAQAPQQSQAQAPALLIEEDGNFQRAWLVAATKTAIRYRETEVAVDTVDARRDEFKTIYIMEPRDYSAAMNLYHGRKFEEARAAFATIKTRYQPLATLENNPSTLAAFFEMECMRRLGDLEGLAAALPQFDKEQLTRESQLRQLELYLMWDAVRAKNWQGVDKLAAERAKTRLPGDQRAQVAYCHGLALEGLERPDEAILAYQTALTADSGASMEIARQSALRILTLLKQDPDVQRAIRAWGTEDENKNFVGYTRLLEASALAVMFEAVFSGGSPLPADLRDLPKFRPPTPKAQAAQPAPAEPGETAAQPAAAEPAGEAAADPTP